MAISQGRSKRKESGGLYKAYRKKKKYELVSVLSYDAIFVKKKYYPLLKIKNNTPETLQTELSAITHFFTGYDGTVLLQGGKRLPWHDLKIKDSAVQILPKSIRKFPDNYNIFEKILFGIYILITDPAKFIRIVLRRINSSLYFI